MGMCLEQTILLIWQPSLWTVSSRRNMRLSSWPSQAEFTTVMAVRSVIAKSYAVYLRNYICCILLPRCGICNYAYRAQLQCLIISDLAGQADEICCSRHDASQHPQHHSTQQLSCPQDYQLILNANDDLLDPGGKSTSVCYEDLQKQVHQRQQHDQRWRVRW